MVFIDVNIPAKSLGIAVGQASDLQWIEACTRTAAAHALSPHPSLAMAPAAASRCSPIPNSSRKAPPSPPQATSHEVREKPTPKRAFAPTPSQPAQPVRGLARTPPLPHWFYGLFQSAPDLITLLLPGVAAASLGPDALGDVVYRYCFAEALRLRGSGAENGVSPAGWCPLAKG